MNTTTTERLPFLDGLRVAAFALLIPYHVGMYYVTWDWHVKSPAASPALEPLMMLTAPWRLGLLFLVAGAASQGLARRRGTRGAWRDRSVRLLLPLLFGMAVVVPPQAYYQVLTQAPQLLPGDGGYLSFWWAYLQGGRYCLGGADGHATNCLTVPTWNHLWFLPYLWVYTVAGIALAAVFPVQRAPRTWPAWAWMLLPAVALTLARVFVFPQHPSTHNLKADLYNHVQYGLLFALGWASRTPLATNLWPAALRLRWLTLGLSLLAWAALVAFMSTYADTPAPPLVLSAARALRGAFSWWAILSACGWAQRAFTGESPWLRQAGSAVFCAYILHQTVIIVLSQWLAPLQLPWPLEALALMALTAACCALAYVVLRRIPVFSLLVGIARTDPSAARQAQPVATDQPLPSARP